MRLCGSAAGVSLRVVRVASRRAKPEIDLQGAHFSTDIEDLLTDPNVDMILELIGGDTTALDLIRRGLAANKPVVTANKAILAAHGNELMAGRGRQRLRFEAAVAGAIPITGLIRVASPRIAWGGYLASLTAPATTFLVRCKPMAPHLTRFGRGATIGLCRGGPEF